MLSAILILSPLNFKGSSFDTISILKNIDIQPRNSKKINISNSEKSQVEVLENTQANREIQSKDSLNSAQPPEKARTELNDNSPKNLANFFNGEIIDLNE